MHASPSPHQVSCTLTGPPTRFHLEEQRLRSPGHMTGKRANQQMSSAPNHERLSVACCTHHPFTLLRFRGVTEQCSGDVTKMLLHFCLSLFPSLAACPFHPSLSITTSAPSVIRRPHLTTPPTHTHTPPHASEPADRATRFPNSCCGVR